MPKLYYGQALRIMAKTMPFVIANFGAHTVFGIFVVLYYGIVLGLCALFSESLPLVSAVIFFGGLGASGWFYHLAKQYVLYLLKAGHIAVMAELLQHGKLPEGKGQVAWGKEQVSKRFVSVSGMSAVDVLLKGIVRAITNKMENVLNIVPIPGIEKFSRTISFVINQACSFVDEAILARAFINKDKSIWEEARDGTILYAMAWKPILFNAVGLALVSWGSFVFFLLLWSPVGITLSYFFPSLSFYSSLSVIALAYLSKVSLGDTFALATTLVAYHEETKSLQPNEAVAAKISAVSVKFKELTTKAQESMRSKSGSQPSHGSQSIQIPPIPEVPVSSSLPPIPQQA